MLTIFNMSLGAFIERRDTGRLSVATLQRELDRRVAYHQMTAEEADDQLERLTDCRFGDPVGCLNPDCVHNGYPENRT